MLTCLDIVKSVCRRIGLSVPVSAVSSGDEQVQQILALSEEEGSELARASWQVLQKEATFTTVAAQVQGTLDDIAPNFGFIVNDSIWNRTLRRPVYGPKSIQDWQQVKAMQIKGPFNSYRIFGNEINFFPAPPAGQECYFEYISNAWVSTSTGGESSTWTNDQDRPLLDDQLLILGTVWRWKQVKGFDFTVDLDKYQQRKLDLLSKDSGKQKLDLGGTTWNIQPGIFIPAGSWGV